MKKLITALIIFFVVCQFSYAQTATGSMKIHFQNFVLSPNSKTISYDVYVQDIDAAKRCAIAGYAIRAQSPQTSLGTNAKTVTLTNANALMGAGNATCSTVGSNWCIKFSSTSLITSWATSELVSEVFPGTRLATVNIANADGSSFSNPQSFNILYSSGAINKSTLSLFLDDGTAGTPASDATTAIPFTQFTGLGSDAVAGQTYEFATTGFLNANADLNISTNQTSNGFYVYAGDVQNDLLMFDIGGRQLISKKIVGRSYVDISRFNKGMYVIVVNGQRAKVMKL